MQNTLIQTFISNFHTRFVPTQDNTPFGWSSQDMTGYFDVEQFFQEELPKLADLIALRDQLAGQAMLKLINPGQVSSETTAQDAYSMADTMLAERVK